MIRVHSRRSAALAVAALGLSLYTSPSHAGEASAEDAARKAEARARLDAGNQLLREQRYEGALAEYEAAYRAYPSPKIRLNIAEAHSQLGNWAEAFQNYEAFLGETDASSDLHAAARTRKEELEAKIAFIDVQSPVEGARVRVDGEDLGETPLEPIPVNPGRHTVVAEKDGYQRFETAEVFTSGERKTIALALVPIQVRPTTVTTVETPAPKDDSSVLEKWWFWAIVGGVVVVGAGVAIAATTGGSDFLPSGELGSSSTSTWERF